MPFLDIQWAPPLPIPRHRPNVDTPQPGEIAVMINDCLFERIYLSDKLSMLTTQDIKQKGMLMIISRTIFRNNTMEKGPMLDFRHNFRLAIFNQCIMQDNKGNLLVAKPINLGNIQMQQYIKFDNAQVIRNSGTLQGLFHILSYSYLEFLNSDFYYNVGFGRGGIIYSQLINSFVSILNSTFIKNSGYQGGLFYSETGGSVSATNCLFESNFAFEGGIGFLQSDGQMLMSDNEYRYNMALRGSLYFAFNSNYELILGGGYLHENGFINHPIINIHKMGQSIPFQQQLKLFNNALSGNSDYLQFLFDNEDKIKSMLQRDQWTDNPQIQVIKARLIVNRNILIMKQILLVKAQSVSEVRFSNVLVYDIQNITAPLVQLDQSIIKLENFAVQQTQSIVPIFDLQSDSNILIMSIYIDYHQGPILNLFNSNATIENSKFQYISFSKILMSLFRFKNAIISISNSTISNINFDSQNGYEPLQNMIFKVTQSELKISDLIAQNFNTILFHSINSQISVESSTFTQISNKIARGLVLNSDSSDIIVLSSTFKYIEGFEGSAIYCYKQVKEPRNRKLSIINSDFEDIKSINGGVVMTINSNLMVRDSTFARNFAGGAGSTLNLGCKDQFQQGKLIYQQFIIACAMEIQNNTFKDNLAQNLGGAIFYDFIEPKSLMNNTYINNSASYGKNYASYPTHLDLIDKNFTEITQRLTSGRNLEASLKIGIFDQKDQLYELDSDIECLITIEDINLSIIGNTKVRAIKGICFFEGISIVGYPLYKSSIIVKANDIDEENTFSLINIPIAFKECISGEVLQDRKCIVCLRGTFSIGLNQTSCKRCPARAECPGGEVIIPKKGAWRKDFNSSNIYDCLNKEACLGGLNSSCSIEYAGIFCSKCSGKKEQKIYGKSNGNSCAECPPIIVQILLGALVLIERVLFITVLLYNLIKSPNRNNPTIALMRILVNYFQVLSLIKGFNLEWPHLVLNFLNMSLSLSDFQDNFYSFDCFLLSLNDENRSTYYTQVIIMGLSPLIMTLLSVLIWFIIDIRQIFQQIKSKLKALTTVKEESSLLKDGYFSKSNFSEEDQQYSIIIKQGQSLSEERRRIWKLRQQKEGQKKQLNQEIKDITSIHQDNQSSNTSTPSQCLKSQQTYQERDQTFSEKIMTTFFVIVMLWHPLIISYSFSLFTCVDYEDGYSYLVSDTSIRCWDDRNMIYQLTIAIIMIIGWGCLFPAWIYWNIKGQRGSQRDLLNLKLFGIYYIGLTDKMFFWELAVMNARKLILILAATLLPVYKQSLKGQIGILVIFLQSIYTYRQKPYIDPHFSFIEDLANISIILTILGGNFFSQDGFGDRKSGIQIVDKNQKSLNVVISCFVILCNAYFLIRWILTFATVQIRNHQKTLKRVLLLLSYQLPDELSDYETDLKLRLKNNNVDTTQRAVYSNSSTKLIKQQLMSSSK